MSQSVASTGDLAAPSGALAVVGGLALLALAALILHRPRLAGTTLIAPWFWSMVVMVTLVGSEVAVVLAGGSDVPEWAAPLRFAAAMSTFCPVMALLGAKRPQNRGWPLIVVTLWAILSLPSIEWRLFGGVAEIHPARVWFLAILVAIGTLNGLFTRYWPSSLLYGAGQLALLSPFVSPQPVLTAAQAPLVGLGAIVASWALVALALPRSRRPVARLDRMWLDFRDAFGLVWALRVAERINTSARMYDWPTKLTWRGFRPAGEHVAGEMPDAVEESLRTLLRRFVSPEWIDARVFRVESPDQNAEGVQHASPGQRPGTTLRHNN